jgi:hypothetical protein
MSVFIDMLYAADFSVLSFSVCYEKLYKRDALSVLLFSLAPKAG